MLGAFYQERLTQIIFRCTRLIYLLGLMLDRGVIIFCTYDCMLVSTRIFNVIWSNKIRFRYLHANCTLLPSDDYLQLPRCLFLTANRSSFVIYCLIVILDNLANLTQMWISNINSCICYVLEPKDNDIFNWHGLIHLSCQRSIQYLIDS